MRKKRSFRRSAAATLPLTPPSIMGPGSPAKRISVPNLANSEPGKKLSAVNAPTDAPVPASVSKIRVVDLLLLARSRIPPMPVSTAPKNLELLGPKEGSKPSFPNANGLPWLEFKAC